MLSSQWNTAGLSPPCHGPAEAGSRNRGLVHDSTVQPGRPAIPAPGHGVACAYIRRGRVSCLGQSAGSPAVPLGVQREPRRNKHIEAQGTKILT